MKATVIGLGAMGAGMAGNLHRAGLLAGAWNRTAERGRAVAAQHGFEISPDLAAATQDAELVITSLSADDDVIEVSSGLGRLLSPGAVVVDTSTISADTAKTVADRLAASGVHFLDAPVSGGREGAEKGTMVMMVGGDETVLANIRPVLVAISSKVVHMGAVGSGQATKAVNQIMAAGINHAVTEALAFAEHAGLDLAKVIDVVGGGAAGNWFLSHRGATMIAGAFEPGFRVALHHKDLRICQQMLAQHHVQLPMIEMTLILYQRLLDAGYGDEDISSLYRLKKQLFDH